jgi:hypothetical protein
MVGAGRWSWWWLPLAAVACHTNPDNPAVYCTPSPDAGMLLGATKAAALQGQCGDLLNGSGQSGASCQTSDDCMPVCCACPTGGNSAQVEWCNQGTCVVGAQACCAWLENASSPDGGAPALCH